jgi:hypothetical protein
MSIYTPLAKAAGHFAMATVEGPSLSDANMDNVLNVAYSLEGQSFCKTAPSFERTLDM